MDPNRGIYRIPVPARPESPLRGQGEQTPATAEVRARMAQILEEQIPPRPHARNANPDAIMRATHGVAQPLINPNVLELHPEPATRAPGPRRTRPQSTSSVRNRLAALGTTALLASALPFRTPHLIPYEIASVRPLLPPQNASNRSGETRLTQPAPPALPPLVNSDAITFDHAHEGVENGLPRQAELGGYTIPYRELARLGLQNFGVIAPEQAEGTSSNFFGYFANHELPPEFFAVLSGVLAAHTDEPATIERPD